MLLILANLRRAAEDDGIPILLDSDPIDWNTAAAAEAARITGAAISRAALRLTRP